MLSSNSSFSEFSNCRICSASPIASTPRAMVPEIGQVSTRLPSRAHEHFRRGRHQKFAVAEVHQRAVGRRIDPAQPLEHFRRRALAGLGEQLPRHRLEQIAARKRGARGFDRGLIFAGRMIGESPAAASCVDAFGRLARQALRWIFPSRRTRSSAPRRARWRGRRPAGDPAHTARCRAGRSRARASARGPRSGTPGHRRRRRTGRAADRHWRRAPPPESRTSDITLARRVRWSSSTGAAPRTIWPARRVGLFSVMTTQGSRSVSPRKAISTSPRAFSADSEKSDPVVSSRNGGSAKPRSKLS